MGLLDDAIREHLDLKRARGGDPAEIERMEREALGPVRREPTIGSARFEAVEENAPLPHEDVYEDDFVELQDAGYHDSTAPHPRARHDHDHPHHEFADPHAANGEEQHDPFGLRAEEPEQPRRRFLRRNRPTSLSDAAPDPGFHEEPADEPYYPMEHHDLPEHDEPLAHDELLEHEPFEDHEALAHDQLSEHDPPTQAFPAETPPHLQFEHPPKRPRFTAEPPSLQPEADDSAVEADTAAQEVPTAPEPAPAGEPDVAPVQETTEFDVQKHLADTRHLPEEPPPPAPAAPAPDVPADEDVLEETPEFLQDTPEHDRLWFEQRPPKDFDF